MSFCIVVERELATSSCPLHKGACVWRHRETGSCMYDPEFSTKSVEDLAELVGAPNPTSEEVSIVHERIKRALTAKE